MHNEAEESDSESDSALERQIQVSGGPTDSLNFSYPVLRSVAEPFLDIFRLDPTNCPDS